MSMAGFGIRERTILVDSLIIVFAAYAFSNYILHFVGDNDFGTSSNFFLYYTNWSNILAVVGAIASLYCLFKGIRIPKALAIFKLAATLMLTVTMLVVVFVLAPTIGWHVLFDLGGMIFLHLLIPLLAIVDFLYLSDMDPFSRRDVVYSLIPMLIYAVGIITVLLIAGNDDLAPYPFLRIHTQPLLATILWLIGLALLAYGIAYGYSRLVRRTNPAVKAE